jgi:hypothetical protein
MGGAEDSEQALGSNPANPSGPQVLGPNPGANSRWRHLGDLVFDAKPTSELRVVLNGTFVADTIVDATSGQNRNVSWWGVSAMTRYALTDMFGLGGRLEFIHDKDGRITAPTRADIVPGSSDISLVTGTLTFEALPTKFLVLRLDTRIDHANEEVFANRTTGASRNQLTSTLGFVVKTP